ncbi:MAG: rhomboid family intramembrane serine protease [Chloroflexi bacterium]|nr:rhomboid family intramembrane serine protease [Chloroflexota bacterium]MBI5079802.1 rhomboid family intramembrane serine protease [Chloroflexota bacterium]MBI5350083.1 rhomboid family intramembrane serine protease [Chloroflexota bacterium]
MNDTHPQTSHHYSVALPSAKPIFTYLLLGTLVVVYILQALSEIILGDDLLFYFGGKINDFIVSGEYWRLVTPIFLHGSLAHLGSNALSLFIFGVRVESFFGHRRFLIVYLLSGVAGVVASFIFSAQPSLGASGAIFGLLGAFTVYFFNNRSKFGDRGNAYLRDMLVLIGIQLFVSFRPGIDLWGHVGGLIGGAAVSLFIAPQWRVDIDPTTGLPTLGDDHPLNLWRGCIVLIFAFALLLITFFVSALRW